MRRHFILLATLAVAIALPSEPVEQKICIDHCKCKENRPSILQIEECDRPLSINQTTFASIKRGAINTISFENVIVDEISEDAFTGFSTLENIVMKKCQFGGIDAKAFNDVKKLKFQDCAFEDSPDFSSEKLEELHFGSCRLEVVPALDQLMSLTFLNLSGNYIKDIEITTFALLFDLEELILSNNEITKLSANLFVNNEDLNSLYLDNNPLKYFYLNTSNNLETLSLKNCLLTTFDERSTFHLTMVSELNLNNNNIESLSAKDLSHMSQLAVLDLTNNSLTKLDDDVFSGNPDLQKVILDSNDFETLPNFTLKNKTFEIYFFSCNNCNLQTLQKDTFKNMPAIVSLELAYNNFTNVENMFDFIPSLKMLDISHNQIAVIGPKAFAKNVNLESINLSGNPLMALNPEVFANNRAIKKIDASSTRLYKLWTSNTTVLESLKKLLVAHNQLTTLSVDDFKVIPNLQAIDLHDNPLQFDEPMCKVISWLEKVAVFPIEYSEEALENLEHPTFGDDIEGFSFNTWSDFHNRTCPEPLNDIDDIDDDDDSSEYDDEDDNVIESKYNLKTSYATDEDEDYYEYDADSAYEDNDDRDTEKITAEIVEDENINLARASYILSVTSVFVLTALVVLTAAVTITLCILRKNSNFNMHKANLPRLKIPLWDTNPSQKKHSGSIYRPLSEDLSGPKTPKLSRYEFTATPTVHTTNP